MTSIPVAICRFFDNNFKRFYLQNKTNFVNFWLISEMYMKFRTFWKKEEYPSLIITEIIASERDVYLNV